MVLNEQVQTFTFVCPWCWELNENIADLSIDQQCYIEDCRVCCHPVQISFSVFNNELLNLHTERAT